MSLPVFLRSLLPLFAADTADHQISIFHVPLEMRLRPCLLLLVAILNAHLHAGIAARPAADQQPLGRQHQQQPSRFQNPDGEDNWNTRPIIGVLTQVGGVLLFTQKEQLAHTANWQQLASQVLLGEGGLVVQ